MFRSALHFFSKKAAQEKSIELKSLLKPQPEPDTYNELARLIAQDVEAYLAGQPLKAKKRRPQQAKKTAEQLLNDFRLKNAIYLEKKEAFKTQGNKDSSEYETLRKEYLESTEAAWTAINAWLERENAHEEISQPYQTSLGMK